jgi:hypothetical protein
MKKKTPIVQFVKDKIRKKKSKTKKIFLTTTQIFEAYLEWMQEKEMKIDKSQSVIPVQ